MTKKNKNDQGEIISELRKIRAQVWREFEANPELFLKESNKLMQDLGMRYESPKKKKPAA